MTSLLLGRSSSPALRFVIVNPRYATQERVRAPDTVTWPFCTAISGRRYYSPALGRFINRDPSEESGGLSLYAFCVNDPINSWDVLGNWPSGFGLNYHQDSWNRVLPNAPAIDLSLYRAGTKMADASPFQTADMSFMHAMTPTGTDPNLSRYTSNLFVNLTLSTAGQFAAMGNQEFTEFLVGAASHPPQDSTSPPHGFSNFWDGGADIIGEIVHVLRELFKSPSQTTELDSQTKKVNDAATSGNLLSDYYAGKNANADASYAQFSATLSPEQEAKAQSKAYQGLNMLFAMGDDAVYAIRAKAAADTPGTLANHVQTVVNGVLMEQAMDRQMQLLQAASGMLGHSGPYQGIMSPADSIAILTGCDDPNDPMRVIEEIDNEQKSLHAL